VRVMCVCMYERLCAIQKELLTCNGNKRPQNSVNKHWYVYLSVFRQITANIHK